MSLDRPAISWPELAKGAGVEATVTDDAEEFCRLLARGMRARDRF